MKRILELLAVIAATVLVIGSVSANWFLAAQSPGRLRWYVVARGPIRKGTQISELKLRALLERVPEDPQSVRETRLSTSGRLVARTGAITWKPKVRQITTASSSESIGASEDFISLKSRIVGRFAREDLLDRQRITPNLISELAPTSVDAASMALSVEAKTEHCASLLPGMRLCFAQNKKLLPSSSELKSGRPWQGLLLLSISPSRKDGALTSLIVRLPRVQSNWLPALASGQWRPIILGELPAAKAPRARAATRKPSKTWSGKAKKRGSSLRRLRRKVKRPRRVQRDSRR